MCTFIFIEFEIAKTGRKSAVCTWFEINEIIVRFLLWQMYSSYFYNPLNRIFLYRFCMVARQQMRQKYWNESVFLCEKPTENEDEKYRVCIDIQKWITNRWQTNLNVNLTKVVLHRTFISIMTTFALHDIFMTVRHSDDTRIMRIMFADLYKIWPTFQDVWVFLRAFVSFHLIHWNARNWSKWTRILNIKNARTHNITQVFADIDAFEGQTIALAAF